MVDNFRVRGAEDFLRLSKALKAAGQKDLRKELNKELRDAVKPLIPQTRAAALSTLPQGGGLARLVSRAPQRAQVRTGQRTAGVRLVVGKRRGSAAASTNRGVVRHPVFGRNRWVEQRVTPGWFDATLERVAPAEVRGRITAALEKIAAKVVRDSRGGIR